MTFLGITKLEDFRIVIWAHVLALRKTLGGRAHRV